MADDETIDRHLVTVLDEVITAIQELKQAAWWAPSADRRHALAELREFLVTQAVAVADAEERIGGRDPSLVAPTARPITNLRAEAHGDDEAMFSLLLGHLRDVGSDVRARASDVAGTEQAEMLGQLADGFDAHLARLAEKS